MTVRLWPSVTPSATNPKASNNTVGTEFEVSQDQGLRAIWYYSTPGTASLPTKTAVWDTGTGTVVPGTANSSPSWSGAVGSGWVYVAYDGSVTLTAGTKYNVTCYNSGAGTWQNRTSAYWTTGAGSAGIANGALSAPSSAAARIGQGVTGGGDAFPTVSGGGLNYWVDVETGAPAQPPGSGAVVQPPPLDGSADYASASVPGGAAQAGAEAGGVTYSQPSLPGSVT